MTEADRSALVPETVQPLLQSLGEATKAISVEILAVDGRMPLVSWGNAVNAGIDRDDVTELREATLAATLETAPDHASATHETSVPGYQILATGLNSGSFQGSVCIVRDDTQLWSDEDRRLLSMAAELCAAVMDAGNIVSQRGRLDTLVSYIAAELMGVSASNISDAINQILADMARFFNADTCFLRYNDPEREASILIDEWPRRADVPEPDPLAVVPWDTDDPVFAKVRDLREPYFLRPGRGQTEYQERVKAASGVPEVSMVMVPLINSSTTRGVLGFVQFDDREWSRSEVGALKAVASLLVQLDARVSAEESLHHRAYHDELTGLPNRRAFIETLTDILKEDPTAPLSVLFTDMDRLKTVNDVLGHGIGDQFLKAVAQRLRESVRPEDIVARLAGDEFVTVLRGVDTVDGAEHIARRLLNELTEPVDVGGHVISRSACVGIAVNGPVSDGIEELLGNADVALLEAKKRGGNTIVSFNDDLRWRLTNRADLEFRLRTAIGDGEMRLLYQPEYDLRGGHITAVEALVRWQHPERGLLSADAFVSVVEEINLSAELGRWVLEEACRQLAEWKQGPGAPPPMVRVNISAGELISADFVGFVDMLLGRYGHAPHELGIEITESTVMREIDDVLATLLGLRRLGVIIAIDDFGTGYSSLSHLKHLPVHVLKIDRSFVSTLGHDTGDRAIVAAIVRLADAFNLTTVAEGVEEHAAVTALLELGCRRAQGFLMSKPVPADEIPKKMAGPGYLGST